jgi:hypothetical protein
MPKKACVRRKPGAELSIEQLKAVARYLGYSLVHAPLITACLYGCRSGNIVKRGDRAFDYQRFLYSERALLLADIPELSASEGAG